MKNLFNDLGAFVSMLTLVDIIFFIAVLVLIILLVVMYYIIRINTWDDDVNDGPSGKNNKENEKEEIIFKSEMEVKEEIVEKIEADVNVLADDILNAFDLPRAEDEPDELLDLATITKAIEYGEAQTIDVSAYEEEQERKAIISYEELLEKHNSVKINYKEESNDEGVVVKKVDLANLTSVITSGESDSVVTNVNVISYDNEEAFLVALKKLKSTLT